MIRTRYAPSPTGYLHIGGLRTALYSYLYAKQNNGRYILRIEDTDQTRYVKEAADALESTLRLMGLEEDEGPSKAGDFGPYVQSQRTDIYRKYAEELLQKGAAYRCFCTPERLEEMRQEQTAAKLAPMYDRTCLKLSEEEIQAKLAAGTPYVIRQKIPHGRTIEFTDLVRGKVKFDSTTIDDQVLMKSDNFPTYHLAVVVDDHLMQITHVIRGEDWLPSTPKHVLLYESFGWEKPEFAHLPLILNKDKTKLSKRKNDVSVESYIKKGYTKDALINYIALCGWHPGEGVQQEIFSMDELIKIFSIEKIHKAGAVFDLDKLDWFNFQWNKRYHLEDLKKIATEIDPNHIEEKNNKGEISYKFDTTEKNNTYEQKRGELLLEKCKTHLPEAWLNNKEKLLKCLVTIEEKILKRPVDAKEYLNLFFEPKDFSPALMINEKMKVTAEIAQQALIEGKKVIAEFTDKTTQQEIQDKLIALVNTLGLKNGQLLWPLRVALSCEEFSPGTFELIHALGVEESLKRIDKAIKDSNLQK